MLVVIGGAVGVAARAALVLPLPASAHPLVIPAVTLAINLLGSLLLGLVVGGLGERHPRVRVLLGTGMISGFTTYSSFAVDTDGLIAAQNLGGGVVYAVATIVIGALASVAGIALASALGRRKADRA